MVTLVRSGLLIDEVSHVAGADEGTAEHHLEPDGHAVGLIGREFFGGHVFGDGEVAAGGLEILADGGDVGVGLAEVAQELFYLFDGFAEADHKA